MVRMDRTKHVVRKRRDLIVPNMIFLTGYNQSFGVSFPHTMESISLLFVSAPLIEEAGNSPVKKETLQVKINVGDQKGDIKKTYYINASVGNNKMLGGIPLTTSDVVSINTDRPMLPASSACLTYNMRIKSKEV